MTEEEIRKKVKNQEYINWTKISCSQILSEEFIREFADNVHWFHISGGQKLSEKFIKQFKDRVDWTEISRYQKLSEEFIREFADKIYFTFIPLCYFDLTNRGVHSTFI